jgi:hypothetical protein
MDNAEVKREADRLMQECRLPEMLAAYTGWFVGGSYSYDLMCWRDLDIYVLDPQHDLKRCFEVGYELTDRLAAKKSRFTNNVGGDPNGFYWGIKLGDERQGAWKLDVWFLDCESYERHAAYSARLRERLTAEKRSIILSIKEAYWQRPEYRDTVTSDLIYRAVLENDVRDASDFERLLKHDLTDRSS